MIQTFIVTLEMSEGTNVTAKELEEAINMSYGAYSLEFIHNDIIVAKARKMPNKKK